MRELTKKQRYHKNWFFKMGMLDSYDYIYGKHPDKPDDTTSTNWWLNKMIDVVENPLR